jgi:hypothetical protein
MCKITDFKHAPCPTCLGKVAGRRDKRFCSIKCKNEHHRIARIVLRTHFGEQEKRLKRNFLILEGALGRTGKKAMVHRNKLFRYGFDIKACTTVTLKNNKLIYELGNYKFSFLNNGIVFIQRIKSLSCFMPVFFRRWELEFPPELEVIGNENYPKDTKTETGNTV